MRILPIGWTNQATPAQQTVGDKTQRQEGLMRAQVNATGLSAYSDLHADVAKRQASARLKGTAVELSYNSDYLPVTVAPIVVAVRVSTMFQYSPQHHANFFQRQPKLRDNRKPPPFPGKLSFFLLPPQK